MKLLSFQSENLVVDYISFKFQSLKNSEKRNLVNYFFNIGFNCYQQSGKAAKPISEPISVSLKNNFQADFVVDNPYWKGTLLTFSGLNAAVFYTLVQKKLIPWHLFSSGILNRFDLYFSRNHKSEDKISVYEFFQGCQKHLLRTSQNVELDKNSKGLILRIGSRRSDNYFRIYETKYSLKFEHEINRKSIRTYHLFLVSNNLEEFEDKLSKYYLSYVSQLLPLNYSYLDWLVVKLRSIQTKTIPSQILKTDYIQKEISTDPRTFVMLLQFLNYAQQLDFEKQSFDQISYRIVSFNLRDFIQFVHPNIKPTNYYQFKKAKKFFLDLQKATYVTSFSDSYFQSLVVVPHVKFEKCQKLLVGKVTIVEELFYYNYPFLLPDLFRQRITKYEFDVRFKVLQVFSSVNIQKEFFIQEFLDSYPSVLSNQQKTNIKKYFIQTVNILKNSDLIESKFKILLNGFLHDVKELNTNNISEGFILYEKLVG